MTYASRVRRLVFDERSPKYRTKVIDNSVFFDTTMAKLRPLGGILPNLQSLVWHVHRWDSQLQCITFMDKNVRDFDVEIHPVIKAGDDIDYVYQMGDIMPDLTHLTLRQGGPLSLVEEHFCRTFEAFPKLRKVVLPCSSSSTRIMEGLSRLKDLCELLVAGPDEGKIAANFANVADFAPALHEGAFPALKHMSFSSPLLAATRFLQTPFFPTSITRLYVHLTATADPDALQELFSAIARQCPDLVDLVIDFIMCPATTLTTPVPPIEARPNIVAFRPLFACRRVTSFKFRWDYPLNLHDHDMGEFVMAWPCIEQLMLNAEAVPELTPSPLTLGALVPFAEHCPRLRQLGLYVNADAMPVFPIDVPFQSLRELSVGASNIAAADPVALFLSQLCSPRCKIVSGFRWPDAYGLALDNAGIFDERRARICEFWVRWNEVQKLLPVVIRARTEERNRCLRDGSPGSRTPELAENRDSCRGSPR